MEVFPEGTITEIEPTKALLFDIKELLEKDISLECIRYIDIVYINYINRFANEIVRNPIIRDELIQNNVVDKNNSYKKTDDEILINQNENIQHIIDELYNSVNIKYTNSLINYIDGIKAQAQTQQVHHIQPTAVDQSSMEPEPMGSMELEPMELVPDPTIQENIVKRSSKDISKLIEGCKFYKDHGFFFSKKDDQGNRQYTIPKGSDMEQWEIVDSQADGDCFYHSILAYLRAY